MTIFAVGLSCSFGAGGLLRVLGWQTMNLPLLPWLGAAALALLWLAAHRRKHWDGRPSGDWLKVEQADEGAATR